MAVRAGGAGSGIGVLPVTGGCGRQTANGIGPATKNCPAPSPAELGGLRPCIQRYMLTDEMEFFIKWGKAYCLEAPMQKVHLWTNSLKRKPRPVIGRARSQVTFIDFKIFL